MSATAHTPDNQPRTFVTDREYYGRFASNYDSIVSVKIIRRTSKTVWIQHPHSNPEDAPVARRINTTSDGDESIMPFGSYSMAMCIRASKDTVNDFGPV
tara:strand:+ start:6280 stop:6576 length:297 start_codon:yes stop_codon:yes gene_type:complete